MNQNPAPKPGLRYGAGVMAPPRRAWETGVIKDYSPATRTYTVQLTSGRTPLEMPRIIRDPGDTSVLKRNTLVVVHDELGFPVIDGILPVAATNPTELSPARVSEIRGIGGEDPVYAPGDDAATHRQPNEPMDVLGGDWVQAGEQGNLFAALAGGVNVVKSSPFAQIRTHALVDMVEIFAKVYRHISSMGDFNIVNDGGKTSLIWRAAADQTTENGAGEENWTIRLDVGATGDLFNFEITTPAGNTLSRIHMSADGRLEFTGVGGIDFTSGTGGTYREDIVGDKQSTIKGAATEVVRGNKVEQIRGQNDVQVSKTASFTVGDSKTEAIGRDAYTYVGGVIGTKIQGGVTPTPKNVAKKIEIINGGVEMVLAPPTQGALPLMQSETHVNYQGGYNFVIQPTAVPPPIGGFNVISSTPASVMLGATGAAVYDPVTGTHTINAVAPFAVMKYEPWAVMMTILLKWLDTHTHGTAMGPSSPPIIPATTTVQPAINPVRSVRVAVGL